MPKLIFPFILPLYGFIACAIPLSRIFLGPIPIYFIDVLACLVLASGYRHMTATYRQHKKISFSIVLLVLALIPTYLDELARVGLLEPTYLLARTLLHIITVWALVGFLIQPKFFKELLFGITLGVLFTASVATLNSLPITGEIIRSTIFKVDILFPQRDSFASKVREYERSVSSAYNPNAATRGDTLVGKSNPTATYLAAMFPFILGALTRIKQSNFTRLLYFSAVPILFGGILFTYSRAAYLSIIFITISYLFLERKIFQRNLLPMIVLGTIAIGVIGFQSDLFKFTFVVEKFDISNEEYEITNQARILAYIRPWQLLANEPTYFIRGAGRSDKKVLDDSKEEEVSILRLEDAEMHSVFSSAIFYRGFLSMLAIFYLYFLLTKTSWNMVQYGRKRKNPFTWFPTASLISLLAIFPAWMTDHYFITKISAHMFLFMLISLIMASQYYFKSSISQQRIN